MCARWPQIIWLDINLLGMSGLEDLKILRSDPIARHIPVLAFTANALSTDAAKGMAAGFSQYLTKPFKINEFLQTIDWPCRLRNEFRFVTGHDGSQALLVGRNARERQLVLGTRLPKFNNSIADVGHCPEWARRGSWTCPSF